MSSKPHRNRNKNRKQGNVSRPSVNNSREAEGKIEDEQLDLYPDQTIEKFRLSQFLINYQDHSLFGCEDAIQEDIDLLKRYSIDRPDCVDFYDYSKKLVILKAPKGVGKTTLCRLTNQSIQKQEDSISVFYKDADISPTYPKGTLTDWIRVWKRQLCKGIIEELCAGHKISFDTDILKAIEYSERSGARNESLYSFLKSRVTIKSSKIESAPDLPEKLENLVQRLSENTKKSFWIFLDEIDQNFSMDIDSVHKVSAAIIAARDLTSTISDLHIRITIRPNVWSLLISKIDALANIRRSVVDLTWGEEHTKKMLASRIRCYAELNDEFSMHPDFFLKRHTEDTEDWLLNQLFCREQFDLGQGSRPPHKIIHTLGVARPRWVISLMSTTTSKFQEKTRHLVNIHDIKAALTKYGQLRIEDLSSEYQSLCPSIHQLIWTFENCQSSFGSIHGLTQEIGHRVNFPVRIEGITNPGLVDIVNLLHFIGFLDAKRLISRKKYESILYGDIPNIATYDVRSPQDNHIWEIHPAFRTALRCSGMSLDQIIEDRARSRPNDKSQ